MDVADDLDVSHPTPPAAIAAANIARVPRPTLTTSRLVKLSPHRAVNILLSPSSHALSAAAMVILISLSICQSFFNVMYCMLSVGLGQ